MDSSTAERWVTISALIVAAMYGYRRVTEPVASPTTAKSLVGVGNPAPLGAFATAWGFTFLIVSIMASAAPGLGGAFAILIAASDFLTNSAAVFADVTKLETANGPTVTSGPVITTSRSGPVITQGGHTVQGSTTATSQGSKVTP